MKKAIQAKTIQTKTVRFVLIALLALELAIPQPGYARDPARAGDHDRRGGVAIVDVRLTRDRILQGRVTDASGAGRAAAEVAIYQEGKLLGTATSDLQGRFALGLRPGVYEIVAPDARRFYRVWSAQNAPPCAAAEAILPSYPPSVRGQGGGLWQRALVLTTVFATAGVLGGLIGYNLRDDAS